MTPHLHFGLRILFNCKMWLRRSDHISDALAYTVPQLAARPWKNRVQDCRLDNVVLGLVLGTSDLPSRRSLHSVGTNRLVVPTSRLSTVGSRAFPVTDPQTWNDLPEDVTSAESFTTFRRLLKTHLSKTSFPDYLLDLSWLSPVDLAVVPLLRPPKNLLIDWLTLQIMKRSHDDDENEASCKWDRPDFPRKCTYKLGQSTAKDSPHRHVKRLVFFFLFVKLFSV